MTVTNCETCDYIKFPEGGHCYMFKVKPQEHCKKHTRYNDKMSLVSINGHVRRLLILKDET